MHETWPISHFKGPTSDFKQGCYNYPRNVLFRFYHFFDMTKNGHIHGFSELYSCIYLFKIAVLLVGQGIEDGCVFVYGYVYAMCLCICAWICG